MSTHAIEHLLNQSYDSEAAFNLYQQVSKDEIFSLVERMAPLIRVVLGSKFKFLDAVVKDELIAAAFAKLWEALSGRSCLHSNAQQFTVYFYFLIKRAMLESLKKMAALPLPVDSRNIPFPTTVRVPHPWDVETAYLSELPVEILRRVFPKIRFKGNENAACRYIALRLIQGKRVIYEVLTKEFQIDEPKFFEGYMTVLMRMTLYDMEKDPDLRSPAFYNGRFDLYPLRKRAESLL